MTNTISTHDPAEGLQPLYLRFARLAGELTTLIQDVERTQTTTPERPEPVQPARNLDLENYTDRADGVTAGITGVVDHALLSAEADLSATILRGTPPDYAASVRTWASAGSGAQGAGP